MSLRARLRGEDAVKLFSAVIFRSSYSFYVTIPLSIVQLTIGSRALEMGEDFPSTAPKVSVAVKCIDLSGNVSVLSIILLVLRLNSSFLKGCPGRGANL